MRQSAGRTLAAMGDIFDPLDLEVEPPASCHPALRHIHVLDGIRLPLDLAQWPAQATAPLREAPFSHEIVLAAQQLPLPHRDPAHRFLAAQVMDFILVTSDNTLLELETIRTMKN